MDELPAPTSSARPPAPAAVADGRPLAPHVADQAAEWLTLLMSGEASDADHQHWLGWRAAHPDHERAWRHIEAVTRRFGQLAPRAGYRALSPYAADDGRGRRTAMRALAWGGGGVLAALLASRTPVWRQQLADIRTGTGEQRSVALSDGTQLILNTGSAIDVRFDAAHRRVRLLAGEIFVATAHALGAAVRAEVDDPRPFLVETAQGQVRALGTRFCVRQWAERSTVAVQQNAVRITPALGGSPRVLAAGESAAFSAAEVEAPQPLGDGETAWTRGQIVAEDLPLGDFLAELGRYRHGMLHCDPAVAGLRISGVFPLKDTDLVLRSLPRTLAVQVRAFTRYWVTVVPAA